MLSTSQRQSCKGMASTTLAEALQEHDVWSTLELTKIRGIYGLENGRVVYEGCRHLLVDDIPYELRKSSKRDQANHVCAPIGEGRKMFKFVVIIDKLHLLVYKGPTINLLGIDGQQWWDTYGPSALLVDILNNIEDIF